METEIRKLRAGLARREGGRGRRFAPELRRQITAVGRGLRAERQSWCRIGRELGLPAETVRRLCEESPGFVAVEVADRAVARDLVVIAPSGYRIEGLDVETTVALLARLACAACTPPTAGPRARRSRSQRERAASPPESPRWCQRRWAGETDAARSSPG